MTIGPDDDRPVPEDPEAPPPSLDPIEEADPADVAEQHQAVPDDEERCDEEEDS